MTNKISGVKLHKQAMFDLYNSFLATMGAFQETLDDYSPNITLKAKIKRQLDSVESIIRKEYKKSIGL